jgi:arylsulfatase A-like enzyme
MKHLLLILSLLSTLSLEAQQPPARPNILWLIAEDFGPELSCYNNPDVSTPNLDALAKQGTRFTHAYTTAPVCSASRSAFMTGMYQTTIGAHNHRSHRDDGYQLPAGVRVLPDLLRDAGYFTANVRTLPAPIKFKGSGKTDWNFTYVKDGKPAPQSKAFDSNDWSDLKSHQPFYAQVNFQETHRPFRAPKKTDPAKVHIPPYYPDHPVTRADMAAYYDDVLELDRKVGVVLKQLERDNLADNTIVVFLGDHGQAHVRGKHFCYEEGLHLPPLIRLPPGLLTTVSKSPAPGTVDDRFIEAIDLTATTLSLASAKLPANMQGKPFLGDHAAPPRQYAFGARDRCDETVFRFRTVRDARYRYIKNFTPDRPFLQKNNYKAKQYPVWNLLKQLDAEGKLTPAQKFLTAPTMPPEELYDLESDPHEIHNLATSTDSAHQAALTRLRAALDKWLTDSDDQGRFPEPPKVIAAEGATKPQPANKQLND